MWAPASAAEAFPMTPPVVTYAGQQVSNYDLARLRDMNWLNDEVINLYLKLVQARAARDRAGSGPQAPLRAHVFQTFFWHCLAERRPERRYNYGNVRRWTREAHLPHGVKNIFELDSVLVPINQTGNHWVLMVINMRERRLELFDSYGGSGAGYFELVRRFLVDDHRDQLGQEIDLSGWTNVVWTVPQQDNDFDCGVFMCAFASAVVRNTAITFSAADIPLLRRRMVLEILNTELFDDPDDTE